MRFQLFVAISVIAVAYCGKVKFTDCGSKHGQVKWVDISNCQSSPCAVKYGQNVVVQMDFIANVSSKNCAIDDYAIIGGVPEYMPFIYDTDACQDHGVKCPIQKGDRNIFNVTVNIEYDFPEGNLTTHWQLLDDQGEAFLCVEIPVTIRQSL